MASMTTSSDAPLALIIGVTGQDGAYLARHLLSEGRRVLGTSRDRETARLDNLKCLGLVESVPIVSMAPNDFRSVFRVVNEARPFEIYNLSGQTSVGLSFEQPLECFESISTATLNILECLRMIDFPCRFFNAGSSECFGDCSSPASESTSFAPTSPYGIAKSTAFWQAAHYRSAYGIWVCTGILGNHESPFRGKRFVIRKIIDSVKSIATGKQQQLVLGNLDVCRDWGWAPDYVRVMSMMLEASGPCDYVIGSGMSHRLRDFVDIIFNLANLSAEDHIVCSPNLHRPSDIRQTLLDPSKAYGALGWSTDYSLEFIAKKLWNNEFI